MGRSDQGGGCEGELSSVDTAGASSINVEKIGAGEGIRTLDPDLGKVVLYP